MAKTLLAWIRDLTGNGPARPEPPQAIRDTVVARVWPYVRMTNVGLLVAVGVGGRLLASAKLMKFETGLHVVEAFAVLSAAFHLVEYVFQRLNLIEKTKPSKPLEPDIGLPVFRRPPPIPDTTGDPTRAAPAARPVGGTIPPERCRRGPSAEWRLEGGYVWRRRGDETQEKRA